MKIGLRHAIILHIILRITPNQFFGNARQELDACLIRKQQRKGKRIWCSFWIWSSETVEQNKTNLIASHWALENTLFSLFARPRLPSLRSYQAILKAGRVERKRENHGSKAPSLLFARTFFTCFYMARKSWKDPGPNTTSIKREILRVVGKKAKQRYVQLYSRQGSIPEWYRMKGKGKKKRWVCSNSLQKKGPTNQGELFSFARNCLMSHAGERKRERERDSATEDKGLIVRIDSDRNGSPNRG